MSTRDELLAAAERLDDEDIYVLFKDRHLAAAALREKALLVAEVRRCWAEEEREFYDECLVNLCTPKYADCNVERLKASRSAEVRAIVEAQP